MKASIQRQYDPPNILEYRQRLARATGLLYLVVAVLGMFAPLALQTLVAPGDAASTADNILGARWLFGSTLVTWIMLVVADVAVAVTLYLLLEPTGRALALAAAALRLVYAAILGAVVLNLFDAFRLLTGTARGTGLDESQRQASALAALDTFGAGFLVALVFFGVHLLALGGLLYRSRYLPRALGILLVAAGVGYIVDSLAHFFVASYGGPARAILLTPAVVGELGLAAWLLVRGVAVPREAAVSPRSAGATTGAR